MLKTGNMDYAWEYLSVAVQHGLKYLTLDPHINLGDYRYDDFYAQAAVQVTGKEPGSMITKKGQSVTYGVTLLRDAPNREAAVAFLRFLLDPEQGLNILNDMGQPPFVPARVPDKAMLEKVPAELLPLVEAGE
jgi:molybdate/tungstate transport system substrate-binding protein